MIDPKKELSDLKLEVALFQGDKLLVSKSMMVRLLLTYDVMSNLREANRILPHRPESGKTGGEGLS